jgi:Cytosol aminopeptidase family, catalytic domain
VAGEVKRRVGLVGKGVTFDSGGYNLKAGAGSMIEMMKFDMGGSAAVLGAARALAAVQPEGVEVRLRGSCVSAADGGPNVLFCMPNRTMPNRDQESLFTNCSGMQKNVWHHWAAPCREPSRCPVPAQAHFIVAACENMIDAAGLRPGDVLVASNGTTVEVNNTDAEGRLTLADALVYAQEQAGVEAVVDIATLTGARQGVMCRWPTRWCALEQAGVARRTGCLVLFGSHA